MKNKKTKDIKDNSKKKVKRYSRRARFFKIVFSMLIIYFVCLSGLFIYASLFNKENPDGNEKKSIVDKISETIKPSLPERTIALIACTDEGKGRTDGIMLISYNSIDKSVSVVSIPRDLKVDIPSEMWDVMIQNFPALDGVSPSFQKINAIPNYGKERGMEFLEKYIEDLLDIQIDYYAHFDFEGFRYIIDSIGGVEFDVPQNMYYSDPTQDLLINLKAGMQMLDGQKAEELLRFRHYTQGDLQRVKVQQDFIKVFIKKVINIKSILKSPSAYLTTITKYIDTNFTIADALKYIGEAKSFDMNNIQTYTLSKTTQTISGISFVLADDESVKEFAYEIFKKKTIDPKDIVYKDSFNKSINILNGSYTKGFAGETQDLLMANGYEVSNIDDFTDERTDETRIYVGNYGYANDLLKFFDNAKLIVNPQKSAEFGYDITIVLGGKTKLNEIVDTKSDNKDKTTKNIDSFNSSIIVLNGSRINGFAGETKKLLQDNGYIIGSVDDYDKERASNTRIITSKTGYGYDLQKYFKKSKISVNKDITNEYGYDIVIILGEDDTLIE